MEPFCTSTLNRADDVNIAKPLTHMEPFCTTILNRIDDVNIAKPLTHMDSSCTNTLNRVDDVNIAKTFTYVRGGRAIYYFQGREQAKNQTQTKPTKTERTTPAMVPDHFKDPRPR